MANWQLLPPNTRYLPEILTAIATVLVIGRVFVYRFIAIPPAMLITGVFFLLFIAVGAVANQVQPGAAFGGVRTFIKYVPFFLLPCVARFTEDQLRVQFRLLLCLAFVQVFVAPYQRFIRFAELYTGDVIGGTLVYSNRLTVFMVCVVTLLFALYLRKRISLITLLICTPILLFPTMINETRVTFVILPVMLFSLFILGKDKDTSLIRTFVLMGIGGLMLMMFAAVYDTQYARPGDGIYDKFFGDKQDETSSYLYRGATLASRADGGREFSEIGRIDSVVLPGMYFEGNWFHRLVGVGIGNAAFTEQEIFEGEYTKVMERYGGHYTTMSYLLWEIGLIGLGFALFVLFLVFVSAFKLREDRSLIGILGLGWLAVVPLAVILMVYMNMVTNSILSILFWILSGIVVAEKRWQLLQQWEAEQHEHEKRWA